MNRLPQVFLALSVACLALYTVGQAAGWALALRDGLIAAGIFGLVMWRMTSLDRRPTRRRHAGKDTAAHGAR